jgi:integrase
VSAKQTKEFLKFARKDKYGVLFELALVAGMRPEEYLGLQWCDVDLPKRTASI